MVQRIKTQELTSLEITETLIERIERINPIINAYCTTTFDLARDMATKADEAIRKGIKFGIINGVPLSLKDIIYTKGIRTTFGSKIYENYVPEFDELVVKRLRKAGCVILGKTNTPEFAHCGSTHNLIFGKTKNPWKLDRTPGGSSGGAAAAVASGISPLAIGSDRGGSIRIPSCFCGVYGLKTSFGRVPMYPTHGIDGILINTYGPITRSVKDAALILDAMKGSHHADKYSLPDQNINYSEKVNEKPNRLKIGYSLDLGYAKVIDSDVEKNVLNSVQKFEKLGWTVEKAEIKMRKPELPFVIFHTVMYAYDFKSKLNEWRDKMEPDLVRMIEGGLNYTGLDIMKALSRIKQLYEIFYQYFKNYDILITPSTAVTAFELGIMGPTQINGKNVSPTGWTPFSFIFNLTGHPAASIPCGWSRDGLPIGMQIVANRFEELKILQVSHAFEEIAPWQDKKPPLN